MKTHKRTPGCNKHLSYAVCLIVLCLGTCALADDQSAGISNNSLEPGSWSLQFSIDDNFQLGAFEGLVISCKRHYSEKNALRLGASVILTSSDDDQETYYLSSDRKTVVENDASKIGFDLGAMFMHYPSPSSRVNVFWGVGPNIGYSKSKSDRITTTTDDEHREITRSWATGHTVHGGAKCVLGTEWFATRNISFMAEYGVALNYSYSSSDSERTRELDGAKAADTEGSVVRTDFDLAYRSVRLGMSVYF